MKTPEKTISNAFAFIRSEQENRDKEKIQKDAIAAKKELSYRQQLFQFNESVIKPFFEKLSVQLRANNSKFETVQQMNFDEQYYEAHYKLQFLYKAVEIFIRPNSERNKVEIKIGVTSIEHTFGNDIDIEGLLYDELTKAHREKTTFNLQNIGKTSSK